MIADIADFRLLIADFSKASVVLGPLSVAPEILISASRHGLRTTDSGFQSKIENRQWSSPAMATPSEQMVRQRPRTGRGRFALGGLYSVAGGRGAIYPWTLRGARVFHACTRFYGANVGRPKGLLSRFFESLDQSDVGSRPAAARRAVDVALVFGLELLSAFGMGAGRFHGPSIGKRNGTVGTNEKNKTVYFPLWNEGERLWISVRSPIFD
jgi:hypothetical protein